MWNQYNKKSPDIYYWWWSCVLGRYETHTQQLLSVLWRHLHAFQILSNEEKDNSMGGTRMHIKYTFLASPTTMLPRWKNFNCELTWFGFCETEKSEKCVGNRWVKRVKIENRNWSVQLLI
jgi:hypothetical protein